MNKGFTLLFASLVVSLILSISVAIAHITLSQLILSSSGKESQFAFYNADSGIECALFYEYNVRNEDDEPLFPSSGTTDEPAEGSIVCAGFTALDIDTYQLSGSATTTTTFSINPSGLGCTDENKTKPSFTVQIDKSPRDLGYSDNVYIVSRGYNTCDATNPRRIERGLYAKFVD